MNTQQFTIDEILESSPSLGLGETGFHKDTPPFTSEDTDMIVVCLDWIGKNTTPSKMINRSYSSYYLKHVVERKYGKYILNGCFIAAALIAGYRFKLTSNGVNAMFNMRFAKDSGVR